MVYCSVKSCGMQTGKQMKKNGDIVTFHKFPKLSPKRHKWVHATGKKNFVPNTASVICSIHFAPECFRPVAGHQRKYLIDGAVPTLHIPVDPGVEKQEAPGVPVIRVTSTVQTLVSRVYYFLKREYEYMKARLEHVDLSPLADILQRTASATGIPSQTIQCVIESAPAQQQKSRRNMPNARPNIQRTKNHNRDGQLELRGSNITTLNVEIIEEDHSDREGVQCNAEEKKMEVDPPTQDSKHWQTSTAVHKSPPVAAGTTPAPAPRRPSPPPLDTAHSALWGYPRREPEPEAELYRLLPSFATDMPFTHDTEAEGRPTLAADPVSEKHTTFDSDVIIVSDSRDPMYSDSSSDDRLYISDSIDAPVHSEVDTKAEPTANKKVVHNTPELIALLRREIRLKFD